MQAQFTNRTSPFTLKELNKLGYGIRELATMARENIQRLENEIREDDGEGEKPAKITVRRQTFQTEHLAFATYANGEITDWVVVFDAGDKGEIEPTMEHFFPGYD